MRRCGLRLCPSCAACRLEVDKGAKAQLGKRARHELVLLVGRAPRRPEIFPNQLDGASCGELLVRAHGKPGRVFRTLLLSGLRGAAHKRPTLQPYGGLACPQGCRRNGLDTQPLPLSDFDQLALRQLPGNHDGVLLGLRPTIGGHRTQHGKDDHCQHCPRAQPNLAQGRKRPAPRTTLVTTVSPPPGHGVPLT